MSDERNIKIRLIRTEGIEGQKFPEKIGGAVFKLDDSDNYMILINANRNERDQVLSFLHECLHIWHRDQDRRDLVDEIEKERHEELRELLELAQSNTW